MTQSKGPEGADRAPASVPVRSLAAGFPPVTLEEVKTQLKIAQAITRHDAELTRLIEEAREFAEPDLGLIAAVGEFLWKLERFPPRAEPLRLPYRNVSQVSKVEYRAPADGTLTEMPAGDYSLRSPAILPTLWPAVDVTWPTTQEGAHDAVQLTFTAGAADEASVPERLKQAILARISWIWSREDESRGAQRAYESIAQAQRFSYP